MEVVWERVRMRPGRSRRLRETSPSPGASGAPPVAGGPVTGGSSVTAGASEGTPVASGAPPVADWLAAASPIPATGGSSGANGLGSGYAAAIGSVLRGRLQGPGHPDAHEIARPGAGLPSSSKTTRD